MSNYLTRVFDATYPPENRVAAGVAATRTGFQVLKGGVVGVLGITGGGLIVLTPEGMSGLSLPILGLTVGTTLISAALSAIVAWEETARKGVHPSYLENLEAQQDSPVLPKAVGESA